MDMVTHQVSFLGAIYRAITADLTSSEGGFMKTYSVALLAIVLLVPRLSMMDRGFNHHVAQLPSRVSIEVAQIYQPVGFGIPNRREGAGVR